MRKKNIIYPLLGAGIAILFFSGCSPKAPVDGPPVVPGGDAELSQQAAEIDKLATSVSPDDFNPGSLQDIE